MQESWQWIFAVIGLVAFIMAIPPIIQMIWGAPKIRISYETEDGPTCRYLVCAIYNEPVIKGWLKHMRIRRETAQDVSADFEIYDRSTNRLVCPKIIAEIKAQTGVKAERVSLPASVIPVSFLIGYAPKDGSKVFIADEKNTQLPVGYYSAKIGVLSGSVVDIRKRVFIVIDKYPYVYWETSAW